MEYGALIYALLPELLLVVAMFAALGVDYTQMRDRPLAVRYWVAGWLAALGLLAGLVVTVMQVGNLTASYGEGQLVFTQGTLVIKALLYFMGLCVIPLAVRHTVTPQASEYFALLLLSTAGMGLVATSGNLLSAFVSLELLSLSLYGLTALHQMRPSSAEAGLKYLTFGGVATGFLLFGISYLYGMTGQLEFAKMTFTGNSMPMLVVVAYLCIFVGLGFKLAVAPFHLWAPDVYQAAPTPVAAWIASGSKIAGVALLIGMLSPLKDAALAADIAWLLIALAVFSIVAGNLGALRQSNLKRLLAYSAIANAGYILVAALVLTDTGARAALYYAVVYALSALGAFAVVALLSDRLGREAEIDDFRGSWKTMPGLSAAFLLFVLSLAGIPPLAGFVGKFYLFFAAIEAGPEFMGAKYWLVALALAGSVVGLYYYLKILKAMLVNEEDGEMDAAPIGTAAGLAVVVLVAAVVIVGLLPEPLMKLLS